MVRSRLGMAVLVLVTACSQPASEKKTVSDIGIHLADMDTSARPGDDFFRYANGGWLKRTEIPAAFGSWGSFHELQQHNESILRDVLQKAAESQDYPEGTDQRKAADFFQSGMDSLRVEQAGMTPLTPVFDKIDKILNRNDVQRFLAEEDLASVDAFFFFSVAPDMKNSARMAAYLTSGGIGMPERDYYLKLDQKSIQTRDRYKQHVAAMLVLAGSEGPSAARLADRILGLETDLARGMLSKEESRDPIRHYNKKSIADLSVLCPAVNWTAYFRALGVKEDTVIVGEPAFLKACDRILAYYPVEDLKTYFKWSWLRQAAPYLSHGFAEESFRFNNKFLLGAEKMRPRWQRVLGIEDQYLGEAIGKLYVATAFPPEAKDRAMEMVDNIRYAFADRIKQLDWMSDSTKVLALAKLSAMQVKIGYPDKWKNYAGMTVDKADTYYGNVLQASRFEKQEQIHKLGVAVDRSLWEISPQTVNAFYNPQFNEIVFPAGILQPPFYDFRADEAVNYGGIGAGIGHEISHGFDDEGSLYDGMGNLRNWWRADDMKKFKEKGKALAAQFSRYEPLPGVFVQGEFTLGENIGDLGGLAAAYDGLHRYYRESNTTPGKIDGLTAEQRFFVSWATIWRAKFRDEALRTQVLTNPHAPAMYRSTAAPSNMSEFYDAFGVRPGEKLYRAPADRIKIW